MKEILLMRHAKSDWANSQLTDAERPLNSKGIADAPLMAEQILHQDFEPEIIYCSIAQRTRQTIDLVCNTTGWSHDLISYETDLYTFDLADLKQFIQQIENQYQRVMLVGHNPAMTYLYNFLSDDEIENLPTSGMCLLQFDADNWSEIMHKKGETLWIGFPRMFY